VLKIASHRCENFSANQHSLTLIY